MRKAFLPILLALLLLSACAAPQNADKASLRVTATFAPVTLLAKEVIGGVEGVSLETMAPVQAGCLHDYQLTMNDRKLLEKSDVLLACGGGMETFLDSVRADHPSLKVCEAAAGAPLIPSVTGETYWNAHLWMSADGAAWMAESIAACLGKADPENADIYTKNAEAFAGKVKALRDEWSKKLENVPNRHIVIFHESFDYVAQDLGLEVVGVIAKEPDEEPTAKELSDVIAAVKEYAVPALFADAQYDDRAAQTVAQETGAVCCTVDSLVSTDPAQADYLSVMRQNYETLTRALTQEGN